MFVSERMNTDASLLGTTPATNPVSAPSSANALPSDVATLQCLVLELQQVVRGQHQRVAELEQAMQELIRRLRRIPRDDWSANQPALFPEAHPDAGAAAEPATPPVEEEPRRSKKSRKHKHGRRSLEELAQTLPVQRVVHELPEAERLCPCCGKPKPKIGERTSQQVEYLPAKLVCRQHVQFTYSCPHCPEHIATAPKPPQPIERGLAGPVLLALIVASKFDDYLPLYRQELILARYGLFVARSTLCDWVLRLGDLVQPLVACLTQEIFQSRVVQTDGTSIEVLLEGLRQTRTGYFWPYLGDERHPYVRVDFSLDKRKQHPQSFLAPYTGYVQVDAYSAYDGCFLVDTTNPKIEVGCWSHAERYFEAAHASDPVRMAEGLAFIRTLFAVEARAKREHLPEMEVLALRQREAVPALAQFRTWLDRAYAEVLPKSPIADAVRYVRNQWDALRRYADTGFLSMDNNAVERINKLIARGRVNWLFVGSPRGGQAAAQLLSLVVTCRRLHMDSFAYLRDVFTRLPGLPPDQLRDLLPDRWLATHPEAKHPPERQSHGHADPNPRRHHHRRR